MKRLNYFVLLWIASLAVATGSLEAAELASFSVQKQTEIITLSVPAVQPYKIFAVSNPERLVIDVPSVPGRRSLALPASYKGKLIKGARFGQFDPETSRFVFDLTRPVQVIDVKATTQKKQIVITLQVLAVKKGAPARSVIGPKAKEAMQGDLAAAAKKAPQKAAPAKAAPKDTISKKPLIVLDPGHGGVDPGTIGPQGTQEKDVVLEYARSLKSKLLKTGRYRVILTREDDRFIMLRKRVEVARKAGGVVFLSLHADSAPEASARGLSVYTVSEKASDQEAELLAARENKADVLAGMDLSEERQDVADILISLAQRETKNRSALLADMLVTRLSSKVNLLPNSHRFAGFAVLKAPDVPSVLIEIGFLSHGREEKLIKSKAYREKVVTGILAGIDAYFAQQKKMGE